MSMFKGLKSKLAEETKRLQTVVANQVNEFNESLASGSSRQRDSEGAESSVPGSALMEGTEDFGVSLRQRRDSASSLGSLDSVNVFPRWSGSLGGHRMQPIPSDLESTTDMESSSALTGASKEQISSVLHKLQGRASSYKEKYREIGRAYNEILKENEKCKCVEFEAVLTTTQDKALRRIEQLREEKQLLSQSKKDLEGTLRAQLSSQDRTITALRQQIENAKSGQEINDELLVDAKPVGAEAAELQAEKEKVKKFEDLLGRCKDSIKSNKEKINQLTAEKAQLKEQLASVESEEGNAGMSDLAAERVAGEWRMRLEGSEKEWGRRLTESDERSAMALAQAKQDMHEEMEKRDSTITHLTLKLKSLESQGSEELVGLQEELGASKEAERMLEAEKKDMVNQLSKSKQEAVRLLKEEEQKQREKLVDEFQEKLAENDAKWEKKMLALEEKHKGLLDENEQKCSAQLQQQEEQMQLAIEEREMQKVAAVTEQDKKNDQLLCQLEIMTTKKLQLETSMEQQRKDLELKMKELVQTIEENSKRHKAEIVVLKESSDKVMNESSDTANSKQILEQELAKATELTKQLQEEKNMGDVEITSLRNEFKASRESFQELQIQLENQIKALELESNGMKVELSAQLDAMKEALDIANTEKDTLTNNIANIQHTLADNEKENETLKQSLESAKREIESLRTEIQGQTSQVQEEKSILSQQLETVRSDLFAELQNKEMLLSKAKEDLDLKTAELQQATLQCKELNVLMNNIKSEKEQAEICFSDNLEKLKQEKQLEVTDVQSQLESLKQIQIDSLKQELSDKDVMFTKKENSLRNETQQKNDELLHFQQVLKEKEVELLHLREKQSAVDEQLCSREAQLETIEREKEFAVKEKDLQIKELGDLLFTLEEAVGVYRDQLNKRDKENESMQQKSSFEATEQKYQLKEMSERIGDLEDAIEVYRTNTSLKSGQVEALSTEISTKDFQMSSLQEKLSAVLRESFFAVSEKDLILHQTEEKLRALEDAVDLYKHQLSDRDNAVRDVKTQLDATRDSLAEKDTKVHELVEGLEAKDSEVQQLILKLEQSQFEKTDAVSERAKSEERTASLSHELDVMQSETLSDTRKKEEEIMALKDHVASLKDDLDEKAKDRETLHDQLKESNEKLKEYEDQLLAVSEKKVSNENIEIEELKSVVAQAEEKLKTRNEAFEKIKEKSLERLKALKNENEDIKRKLLEQTASLESQQKMIEEKLSNEKKMTSKIASLTEAVDKKAQQLTDADANIVAASRELDNYADKFKALEIESDMVKKELLSRTETLEKMSAEQAAASSSIVELQEIAQSAKISELEAVKNLNSIIEEKDEHIRQLMERIEVDAAEKASFAETADIELQKTQEKCKVAEESEKRLSQQLEQEKLKNVQLLSQAHTHQADLQSLNTELENTRLSLKKLTEQTDTEKLNLQQQADMKIADYKKKAEIKIAQIKKQVEKDKEMAVGELQRKCADLDGTLTQRNVQVEKLTTKCSDLEEELIEAAAIATKTQADLGKNTELKQELVEARRKVADLEVSSNESDQLRLQVKKLITESDHQKHLLDTVQEEHKTAKTIHSEEICQLRHEMDQKRKEFNELKLFNTSLKDELDVQNYADMQTKIIELKLSAQQMEQISRSQQQVTDELNIEKQCVNEKSLEISNLQESLVKKENEVKDILQAKELEEQANIKNVEGLQAELNLVRQQLSETETVTDALTNCKADCEARILSIVVAHDEKVKTLAKEFEMEMQRKEREWQEEIAGCYDKSEDDRQKLMKDYQKEVKQLYKDLNERSQALEDARRQLEEEKKTGAAALESLKEEHQEEISSSSSSVQQDAFIKKETQPLLSMDSTGIGGSEDSSHVVSELEEKVRLLQSEIDAMKSRHEHEMDMLVKGAMSQNSPHTDAFHSDSRKLYLRNVLYRYMTERETMGKESVTLARVIATVLKFTASQTEKVVGKEEARQHTW